jgi:thymidine kinase
LTRGLVEVCLQLADQGDEGDRGGAWIWISRRNPFGPIPALCAVADDVTKVHAICVECGRLANYSHRLVENDKQVMLGETEEYQPLCRRCYLQAMGKYHLNPK